VYTLEQMQPDRLRQKEINWQGQVKRVLASELKPGVVYIDRNTANFALPMIERKLLILQMTPRGENDPSKESKYYNLVAQDERGNIVHPLIGVLPESYFDIVEQAK